MPKYRDRVKGSAPEAGKRRVVIILMAGLVVLLGFFVVTKVVLKPLAASNPISAVTSAADKARSVANKANAANQAGVTVPPVAAANTTTTMPHNPIGPVPDAVRNPFVG